MSIKQLAYSVIAAILFLTAVLFILGCMGRYSPASAQPLDRMIVATAHRNHVPVALMHRIIRVESGYRCRARNGHAFGIMQVQRATARSVGVRGNLLNCATGLEAGARYLHQALVMAHGNLAHAATLYNRGIWARPRYSHYAALVMRR